MPLITNKQADRLATPKNLPPLPKGKTLSGNLSQIRAQGKQFYLNQSQKYNGVFRFRMLHETAYVVNEPGYLEQVFITNRSNFIKGRSWKTTRIFGGDGLLTSEGDFWLRQRRLSQPAFHRERLVGYSQVMSQYASRMVESWKQGETHNIFRDMRQLTLEIVCKTLFDADITNEGQKVGELVEAAVMAFNTLNNKTLNFPLNVPTRDNLQFKQASQKLDQFLYSLIDQRRTNASQDKGDLLSTLVSVHDEDGSQMTTRQLRDEVLTLLMAGHETTASVLTWALYLLSKHPTIEARLSAELDEVLEGRPPTLSDLTKLTYTEQVIKETLRLYPSFWITVRDVVGECEIGGYTIPAGVRVCIMPWVIHRDPRYYSDPETFNPERWTPEFSKQLPKFAYLPFGAGPRQCIGNAFAMIEAQIVLTSILQRYNLALSSDQSVIPARSILLRPQSNVDMILSNRVRVSRT